MNTNVATKEAFPGIDASPDFVVIAPVDASKPPRVGRQQDRLRIWAAWKGGATLQAKIEPGKEDLETPFLLVIIVKVADLSHKHLRKQSHRWYQAGSKYWFPGFGFDSGPNLHP